MYRLRPPSGLDRGRGDDEPHTVTTTATPIPVDSSTLRAGAEPTAWSSRPYLIPTTIESGPTVLDVAVAEALRRSSSMIVS
jgi:hypothetical protein